MKYRHHRAAPGTFKRSGPKRSNFFLNYVPKPGLYCVVDTKGSDLPGSMWTPLACHRVAQDALEDDDVPVWQGQTRHDGVPRKIGCMGRNISESPQFPYKRKDGRPIVQIEYCKSHTTRKSWHHSNWEDELVPEDQLGDDVAVEARSGGLLFLVLVAAGLYVAVNRNKTVQ